MESKSKLVSSLVFAASVLCFFFPFVSVSCNGLKLLTLTGAQLVTGTSVNQPEMFGQSKTREVNSNPWAILAAVCAIGGVALSFAGLRTAIVAAVSGGVGAVSLLVMKTGLDNDVLRNGNGLLQIDYEAGFFLALILLFAGAGLNVYFFLQRGKTSPAPPPTTSHPPPGG